MNMKYTDNMKGFRRRNVLVKLEHLLQDIVYKIEYIEDVIEYENDYMNGDEYHEWSLDLEFWQEKYSSIRTIYCLVARGSRISRIDLEDCNETRKMLP